jgi:glycosyltransferase involved in cell wall biosynthesis
VTVPPAKRPLSVGFIGPFPPTRSGIADYDSEIFSSLSKDLSLSLVPYEPSAAVDAMGARHDVLLFQIGNDPVHAPSVEALFDPRRRTPAVVVLHDFVLHHLFAAAYLDRGREDDYARELERAHGPRGRALAERGRRGARVPVWDLDPWAFPMSAGVIRAANAVVAHSELVKGAVLAESPATRTVLLPHHVVPAPRMERAEARRALGLPPDRPVAVTLGVVTPAKRVGRILEALAALPPARRPFLFVGGAVADDDPLHLFVEAHGLSGDVAFGGYLSESDFWRAASAADFGVNLRHPTMGETSGAVCRLAGSGLPLIVSDTGWFRELPDAFAAKIPVGGDEVARLAEEMTRLAFEPDVARLRARAASEWGEERRPDQVACGYRNVLESVAGEGVGRARGSVRAARSGSRLSVGFIGPFPPVRSGIADYDAELFPALAAVTDARAWQPEKAREALTAGHDVLLIEIGNDPLHVPSVEALFDPGRRTPAVVVLHEFVLHHLFAAGYLMRGREGDYERELERAHGSRGKAFAATRRSAPFVPMWDLDPWAFPMSAGVIRAAEAVVAHSALVTGAVLFACPGTRAVTIPQHVALAPRSSPAQARAVMGLPLHRPVAMTLGIVGPAKRIGRILEALAALPPGRRPFLFVGGAVAEDDPLRTFVRENGLVADVKFGGYLSEEDLCRAASAATFAVNLRFPTLGETSHAVCRLAGYGLPLIVSDTGWFRELPDAFTDKIPIGGDEVARLARAMERLSFDVDLALDRGAAAAAWAVPHRPERIAEAYRDVLEEAAAGWSRPRGVSGRVSEALTRLGVARPGPHGAASRVPDGILVAEVAARAAGVLPRCGESPWNGKSESISTPA